MNLHETVVRRWLKQVELQKTGQGNCCKTPRQCCVFLESGHPRNTALLLILMMGLAWWKVETGYHKLSIAENAMYRLKQLFGGSLASRKFITQESEIHARLAAMETMTYLGVAFL